jgi:methyl-accepting chemotaxis protein
MSIFGKKFDRFANKIGHKFNANSMQRFATKVAHGVHTGLDVANKVVRSIEKGSRIVANVADKIKGVPVIGGVASTVATAARVAGRVAHLGDKGVKGLEKAVSKAEDLGHTIHSASKNIKRSNYHIDTIKKEGGNVLAMGQKLRR